MAQDRQTDRPRFSHILHLGKSGWECGFYSKMGLPFPFFLLKTNFDSLILFFETKNFPLALCHKTNVLTLFFWNLFIESSVFSLEISCLFCSFLFFLPLIPLLVARVVESSFVSDPKTGENPVAPATRLPPSPLYQIKIRQGREKRKSETPSKKNWERRKLIRDIPWIKTELVAKKSTKISGWKKCCISKQNILWERPTISQKRTFLFTRSEISQFHHIFESLKHLTPQSRETIERWKNTFPTLIFFLVASCNFWTHFLKNMSLFFC